MPFADLESRTAMLFSTTDALLGDTITVTTPSGAPATIKANVNHRDKSRVLDFATATAQDIVIDLDKALFGTKPNAAWRITLPRLPGKIFSPRDVNTDDSGFRWEFGVKEVPSA